MALLSVGVTLDGRVIAFPDCVRVHGPPNERIWRAIKDGKARMAYIPRKRWSSGHAAESVGSESYLRRIAEKWADMEPATIDKFEDNFHQSWWSQVEEVAYTVYFAEAAGCGAFNCASVGDALEYIRAWVWEEVEVSGDWMPSPREEEERIAVVGAGISLPPKQKEKATAYQAEARRRKGMRVGWISRKEVA